MLSIFTSKRTFDDKWIGHPFLNRHRLHRWRMNSARTCVQVRKFLSPPFGRQMEEAVQQLDDEGFAVIGEFLPVDAFAQLSAEVETAFRDLENVRPVGENRVPGFGSKQHFPGGFDRYDGGTLNRFLTIGASRLPASTRFAYDARLAPLTRAVCGLPHDPRKTHLYLTIHGSEQDNPDLQKVFHRDTYFSSMKLWYFVRPVTSDDGPFVYVPRSHLLTSERLDWEERVANLAAEGLANVEDRGGSFRISEQQITELHLPRPVTITCAANTLVIANTLGFHRRGDARPGRQRVAIYGWHRPFPFDMIGIQSRVSRLVRALTHRRD